MVTMRYLMGREPFPVIRRFVERLLPTDIFLASTGGEERLG
jgi:hypothetical protein